MILKVVKDSHGIDDHSISVPQMRKMVRNFKMNPEGGWNSSGMKCQTTSFANFPLSQILQLLVDDGVIKNEQTVSQLLPEQGNIGVKMYFSQHVEMADCPATPADYVGYNTVFLVTCVWDKNSKLWNDLINYGNPENSALFVDSQTGTDKANLCPPQCSLFGNKL